MNYASLKKAILDVDQAAAAYHHRQRLWRIAENIRDHSEAEPKDRRLLHLMSRVGSFSEELAEGLRSERLSQKDAIELLILLASLGNLSFSEWSTDDGRT